MSKVSAFGVVLALFALPAVVSAQGSASMTARVLSGITVTESTGLNFGDIEAAASATTTVSPDAPGTGQTVANLTIAGTSGVAVTVSWTDPASTPIAFTGPVGATGSLAMTAADVRAATAGSAMPATSFTSGNAVTLDGTNGEATVWVGGTVTQGATAPSAGTWTGTFSFSVAY
ncbi:MAG TPA: hypothetical protein VMK65_10950 [Longimicrobiales bacterium]|nr:hypothetical protein [Longimicrobiales bacterium]